METSKFINEQTVILGWRGSIAHGLYIPPSEPMGTDDKDLISICIPGLEYYFGLSEFGSRGTIEIKDGQWDVVVYELKKFISLLVNGNPNVISALWMTPEDYIYISPEGQRLINNRDLFLSKKIYHSFIGYSYSQFSRMNNLACQGYMGEKRKLLVNKFGYDTKNASHCIRLMRMCIEFLETKQLNIKRVHDANELISIKLGAYTLEEIKSMAQDLFVKAKDIFESTNWLPEEPDIDKINTLSVSILKEKLMNENSNKIAEKEKANEYA